MCGRVVQIKLAIVDERRRQPADQSPAPPSHDLSSNAISPLLLGYEEMAIRSVQQG
jgi:hypothetical protein